MYDVTVAASPRYGNSVPQVETTGIAGAVHRATAAALLCATCVLVYSYYLGSDQVRRRVPTGARSRHDRECTMPYFVLMTRLAPESMEHARGRRAMGKEWLEKVKAHCQSVNWIAHYALLGPYDFMDIYEAPDIETAQRVSLISRAEGALTAESWPAIPYDKFLGLMEEVEP